MSPAGEATGSRPTGSTPVRGRWVRRVPRSGPGRSRGGGLGDTQARLSAVTWVSRHLDRGPWSRSVPIAGHPGFLVEPPAGGGLHAGNLKNRLRSPVGVLPARTGCAVSPSGRRLHHFTLPACAAPAGWGGAGRCRKTSEKQTKYNKAGVGRQTVMIGRWNSGERNSAERSPRWRWRTGTRVSGSTTSSCAT